jgi:hypothetical protein
VFNVDVILYYFRLERSVHDEDALVCVCVGERQATVLVTPLVAAAGGGQQVAWKALTANQLTSTLPQQLVRLSSSPASSSQQQQAAAPSFVNVKVEAKDVSALHLPPYTQTGVIRATAAGTAGGPGLVTVALASANLGQDVKTSFTHELLAQSLRQAASPLLRMQVKLESGAVRS